MIGGSSGEMMGTANSLSLVANKLSYLSVYVGLIALLVCSDHATCRWTIRSLPGFPGSLPFYLETGYLSVDESNDVQLFYYFVKSERNPKDDPLMLWISGGPGCSALTGLAFEIGPLYFRIEEYNGSLPTLTLNPNSWTKVSNIIFLDAPVGTGFSYSTTSQGSISSDTLSPKQTYSFIRKWLIDHPEFLSNPFYVGGDSYSGITNPIVVQYISDGIIAGIEPHINLKGYLLGNPVTDEMFDDNSKVPFAHGMALISNELYESTKKNCEGEYVKVNPKNAECLKDLEAVSMCTSDINPAQILEPNCLLALPKAKEMSRRRSLNANSNEFFHPPPIPALDCRSYGYMLSYYWANSISVRKALHIRKGTKREWMRCNAGLPYIENVESSIAYHLNLSARGYRSLIYSGDHDSVVPFLGTQAWIKYLNYSIVDDWRPWFVHGQVAGYTRTYSNLMTYATVKGGGHTAPEYRPKQCLPMLNRKEQVIQNSCVCVCVWAKENVSETFTLKATCLWRIGQVMLPVESGSSATGM